MIQYHFDPSDYNALLDLIRDTKKSDLGQGSSFKELLLGNVLINSFNSGNHTAVFTPEEADELIGILMNDTLWDEEQLEVIKWAPGESYEQQTQIRIRLAATRRLIANLSIDRLDIESDTVWDTDGITLSLTEVDPDVLRVVLMRDNT